MTGVWGQHKNYILTLPQIPTPKCFFLDIKKGGHGENNYNRPSGAFASLSLLFQTVNSTAQAGKELALNVFTGFFLRDL